MKSKILIIVLIAAWLYAVLMLFIGPENKPPKKLGGYSQNLVTSSLKIVTIPTTSTTLPAPTTTLTTVKPLKRRVAPSPVKPAPAPTGGCEQYRPLVQQYFVEATDVAMLVMSKESGCNPNARSATNDHGLFQLNGQRVYDPEANIRIAHGKFVRPRVGSSPNWSAWYAVCTPGNNPQPKYTGVWCR